MARSPLPRLPLISLLMESSMSLTQICLCLFLSLCLCLHPPPPRPLSLCLPPSLLLLHTVTHRWPEIHSKVSHSSHSWWSLPCTSPSYLPLSLFSFLSLFLPPPLHNTQYHIHIDGQESTLKVATLDGSSMSLPQSCLSFCLYYPQPLPSPFPSLSLSLSLSLCLSLCAGYTPMARNPLSRLPLISLLMESSMSLPQICR